MAYNYLCAIGFRILWNPLNESLKPHFRPRKRKLDEEVSLQSVFRTNIEKNSENRFTSGVVGELLVSVM